MQLTWLVLAIVGLASPQRQVGSRSLLNSRPHQDQHSSGEHLSIHARDRHVTRHLFAQYIDHDNPELGTFSQRYGVDTTYWNGTGSPVVFLLGEEFSIDGQTGFFNPKWGTIGLLASKIGAATVVLEHRYHGRSSPFDDWTTQNLRHLTVNNAIQDAIHFANTCQFSFSNETSPTDVPWIATSLSYSGALVAWTANLYPEAFWAYYASSATVWSTPNDYGYFVMTENVLAENCTKDLKLIAAHIDDVLINGSPEQVHELKARFGMEILEHNDDFAFALAQEGPGLAWHEARYLGMCDYIELGPHFRKGLNGTNIAPAGGVGLDQALSNWAATWKTKIIPHTCDATYDAWGIPSPWKGHPSATTSCFDSYNPPTRTDLE